MYEQLNLSCLLMCVVEQWVMLHVEQWVMLHEVSCIL